MTPGGVSVPGRARPPDHRQETTNLADILLTIKIRLLVASVDKAREMGIDWWEHDPTLSSGQPDLRAENRELRERIGALEAAKNTEPDGARPAARARNAGGARRG